VKLLFQRAQEEHPEDSFLVRAFKRFVPALDRQGGEHFTVVKDGKRYATPLLLALAAVEFSDVVFALDSIPANFAIAQAPFIVFTSNIFAILGLRSMYFLLAGVRERFTYLEVGPSFVLLFVGTKMLVMDVYKVPVGVSLCVIAGILGLSMLASWWEGRRGEPAA